MSATISENAKATAIMYVEEISELANNKYTLRRFMKKLSDMELSLMHQRCEKFLKWQ
jgi:hypothetical protein